MTLASSVLMEAMGGTSYLFSVYSPALKESMNFTQADIQGIASVGNIGGYMSIPAGLFFDAYGPMWSAIIGSSLVAIGYSTLWAGAAKQVCVLRYERRYID